MDDQFIENGSIKEQKILLNESELCNQSNKKPFLELTNINKKKLIFKISYCPKNSLFTKTKINPILFEEEKEKENFLKIKKSKRNRKEHKDNIRKKIKRGFLNNAIINKLNTKLKMIGINNYFEKFPQFFASDVVRKRNKNILSLTLREIFEKKELYTNENEKGLENYLHNLEVIKSKEVKENEIFKNILNKTFWELFEEYLNSDDFKIDEINRIKMDNVKDDYIKRYKDIARGLIKFFSK